VRKLALVLLLAAACRRDRPNVLIVTFDTSRADAFGAYGARTVATTNFDALAARGALFEQADAPVPLTLPSHTSILTGTFPPFHGVRENGNRTVPAQLVTLAELLHENGYRTGAFVGAYVLDARWGLNQGFDLYSGNFDATSQDVSSIGDLRRSADRVADDAAIWIRAHTGQPFFAWVHFYDPHSPYDPPQVFASRFNDPYTAEIAFADSQLGRLLTLVGPNTIVIVTADHGEGFGEHGERGHGLLLYEESLHVPLAVVGPGIPHARVQTPVSLVDIYPTIAELVQVKVPAAVQGHSLMPLIRGSREHATPVFAETMYPRLRYGWSELRSLRTGSRKVIESTKPELYDLADDPKETHNLATGNIADARRQLQRTLAVLGTNAPAQSAQTADLESRARLAALGYVSAGAPAISGPLPSPRDKMAEVDALNRARNAIAAGNNAAAEQGLHDLVQRDGGMLEARVALGELYLRTRQPDRAVTELTRAAALSPSDPAITAGLATALIESGKSNDALQLVRAAIPGAPQEPRFHFLAGRALEALGRLEEAKQEFERTLTLNARSAAAHVELAAIAISQKQPEHARDEAQKALTIDAHARGGHLFLAQALDDLGRRDDARREASIELQLWPDDFRAAVYLAELTPNDAERYLRLAIQIEPRYAAAYLRLAQLLLKRNERFDEGVRLTQQALALHPSGRDEALAYFLLADLYNRLGREDLSRDNARLGQQAARSQ
jgi:arylsulfatase A-like enzyme/Tfp pilus assembly protein PilF